MKSVLDVYKATMSLAAVEALAHVEDEIASMMAKPRGTIDYEDRIQIRLRDYTSEADDRAVTYILESQGWVNVSFIGNNIYFYFPSGWK